MPQPITPDVLAARERKAETARANGRKSTGPKTEAGKNISRLNRVTHGRRTHCIDQSLCLNIVLLEGEDRTFYLRLYEERCAALGPRNQVEKDICARITGLHWMINRLQATHTAAFEDRLQIVPEEELPGVSAPARAQFHFLRAFETLAVQSAALLRTLRAEIAAHERSLRAAYAELAQLRKLGPVCTGPVPVYPEREIAQTIYSTGTQVDEDPDQTPDQTNSQSGPEPATIPARPARATAHAPEQPAKPSGDRTTHQTTNERTNDQTQPEPLAA